MYKKTSLVAIATATVLALSFGAAARAADPAGPQGGPGMHHHWHHGGPMEVFKRLHDQLELTPAQEQQWQAAEATAKQNREAMRQNLEQGRSQFEAAAEPADPRPRRAGGRPPPDRRTEPPTARADREGLAGLLQRPERPAEDPGQHGAQAAVREDGAAPREDEGALGPPPGRQAGSRFGRRAVSAGVAGSRCRRHREPFAGACSPGPASCLAPHCALRARSRRPRPARARRPPCAAPPLAALPRHHC